MPAIMEVSGAMHIVKEVPAEDDIKLAAMARVFLRADIDLYDMIEFAQNAYKIGRETEARRNQCFCVGSLEEVERISILRALEATSFNPIKAARVLKIARTTMYRKLQYFGIDYGRKKEQPEETEHE